MSVRDGEEKETFPSGSENEMANQEEQLDYSEDGNSDNNCPELMEQETSSDEEGLIQTDDESEKEITFNFSDKEVNKKDTRKMDETNAIKLKKIDREMKQKLMELHQMMKQGGLEESAEFLAQLPQLKDSREKEGRKNKSPGS